MCSMWIYATVNICIFDFYFALLINRTFDINEEQQNTNIQAWICKQFGCFLRISIVAADQLSKSYQLQHEINIKRKVLR